MTTEEYNNEIPKHYFLRVEGYNNKVLREERSARKQTFLMLAPNMKNPDYKAFCRDLWPLPEDEAKRTEAKVMTPEMMKKIKEKHNKHIANARTSNKH